MRPAQVVLHIANMYVVISLNYVVSTQKFGLQRLQSFQTKRYYDLSVSFSVLFDHSTLVILRT